MGQHRWRALITGTAQVLQLLSCTVQGPVGRMVVGHCWRVPTIEPFALLLSLFRRGAAADKVLRELIEPYELRVAKLREFLADVQPSVLYDIVPLGDPYGPAITDPELRCIVVSEETRKGGEAVNKKRIENVTGGSETSGPRGYIWGAQWCPLPAGPRRTGAL